MVIPIRSMSRRRPNSPPALVHRKAPCVPDTVTPHTDEDRTEIELLVPLQNQRSVADPFLDRKASFDQLTYGAVRTLVSRCGQREKGYHHGKP